LIRLQAVTKLFTLSAISNPTYNSTLDSRCGDALRILSTRDTGKNRDIVLVIALDAAHFKTKYNCLITRTTFKRLAEIQGLLCRYMTLELTGTTYSSSEVTFRPGVKNGC